MLFMNNKRSNDAESAERLLHPTADEDQDLGALVFVQASTAPSAADSRIKLG